MTDTTDTGCANRGPSDVGDAQATSPFDGDRLERVFERCFSDSENTALVGGAAEPLYRPAQASQPRHLLFYREDYFASALHEVAHWCIAGPERRRQLDFGYWYAPEGRDARQQQAFESVEVKPQALEWYFAKACGYPFRVSVDNLDPRTGAMPDTADFRRRVLAQARLWRAQGLPARAGQFFHALAAEFGTRLSPCSVVFEFEELR